MRLYSTATMIERLTGLIGTNDLTEWEQEFVRKLDKIRCAGHVTDLSDKQVERLDELHSKHFA
ncbi:hypothetical protein G3O06_07555 [Burkholderia sp. Ac-20345]|uniref:hypothetical protein n=1 Tax=Burkholderia sp. Ac-20345 TaxID=2703891 RepID=UPI00197C74B5|nr:hypothetical protein [Burkholderia sp. Ac-20345]MBN3777406.1 hypothetical protein [Burkholderia sp. Ac-20345]